MPLPMAIMLRRSIGSGSKRHGIWVNSMGNRIWSIRGSIVAIGSRDQDEVVIGVMDKKLIREVRDVWQFYWDRRPET